MATTSFYVFSMQSRSRVLLLLLLLHVLYLSLPVESISVKIEDFNNSKLYSQELFHSSGKNTLTDSQSYDYEVYYTYKQEYVQIWDSKTRELTDFSTQFSFSADTLYEKYGGGMTFFLAPTDFIKNPPRSKRGGFLGLYEDSTYTHSSQSKIVHVEFDMGLESWDPSFPHVGININSLTSSVYTRWYASSHNWDAVVVLITYESMTKKLSVSWRYQSTSLSYESTSLSYYVDLRNVLPQQAIVGFSAATSTYALPSFLYSWEFSSGLNTKETSTFNNGNCRVEVNLAVGVVALVGLVLILFSK